MNIRRYDADKDGKLGASDMRGLMAKLKPPEVTASTASFFRA